MAAIGRSLRKLQLYLLASSFCLWTGLRS